MFKKILSLTVIVCFFLTTLGPLPKAHADSVLNLPAPGTMVNLSPAYQPVIIKGLTVHKDNPFLFDFIVDVGQDKMSGEPLKKEGEKLIKYFLASLAIPDKDVWVNLSPYEKNRMIPEALGQTDMGRDLLEQDYILKQITASLIYPEKDLGKKFWDKVYSKAQQMYGTTQIPVNTFNKVWIMADRAEVFEHNQTAFVVDSHLKVMLEEDYLALQKHNPNVTPDLLTVIPAKGPQTGHSQLLAGIHSVGSQIVKQIILPELEKEVNTGKNFANLRQIFNSIILSSWYKKNLKEALLNQVYADKSKINGVIANGAQQSREQIYEQYLKAYKKGVFNYIKEEVNAAGTTIPRKYFSGGMEIAPPKVDVITDPAMGAIKMNGSPWHGEEDFQTGLNITQPENTEEKEKSIIDGNYANVDFEQNRVSGIILNPDTKNGLKNFFTNYPDIKASFRDIGRDGIRMSIHWNNEEMRTVVINALLQYADAAMVPKILKVGKENRVPIANNTTVNFALSANFFVDYIDGVVKFWEKGKPVDTLYEGHDEYGYPLLSSDKIVRVYFENDQLYAENVKQGAVISYRISDSVKRINGNIFTQAPSNAAMATSATTVEEHGRDAAMVEGQKVIKLINGRSYPVGTVEEVVNKIGKSLLRANYETSKKVIIFSGFFKLEGDERKVAEILIKDDLFHGGSILGNGRDRGRLISVGDDLAIEWAPSSETDTVLEQMAAYRYTEEISALHRIHGIFEQWYTSKYDSLPYSDAAMRATMQSGEEAPPTVERVVWNNFVADLVSNRKAPVPVPGVFIKYRVPFFRVRELDKLNDLLGEFDGDMRRQNSMGSVFQYLSGDGALDKRVKDFFITEFMHFVTFQSDRDSDSVMDSHIVNKYLQIIFDNLKNANSNRQILAVLLEYRNMLDERGLKLVTLTDKPFVIEEKNEAALIKPVVKRDETDPYWLDQVASEVAEREEYSTLYWHVNPGTKGKKEAKREMIAWIEQMNRQSPIGISNKNIPLLIPRLEIVRIPVPREHKYGYIIALRREVQERLDAAMAADKAAVANVTEPQVKGGIDLNTSNGMQWKVSKDGNGVEMNIDPAMIGRIRREGIDSLSPVIFKITPISSIWPLVGLQAPAQAGHLSNA